MDTITKQSIINCKKTRDLIRMIESLGYTFKRQNGSHMSYAKENHTTVVIPNVREVATGTKRQIANCIFGV